MTKPTLTDEQANAIRDYAKANGRTWKSKLREAWMTGRYERYDNSAELQTIRNTLGPAWLVNYKPK